MKKFAHLSKSFTSAFSLAVMGITLNLAHSQIIYTTAQTFANPAAAAAVVNPLGIQVNPGAGQIIIATTSGTYTFGNNPLQPILLNVYNTNGTLRINNTAPNVTLTNNITVLSLSSAFMQGGGTTLTYTGVLSGSGPFEKRGGGVLDLTNANTYSGNFTVQNGELRLSNTNALQNAASLTALAGTTVQLNVAGNTNWNFGTGNIILQGGTLRQISGVQTDIANISNNITLVGTGTLNAPGDSRMYVQGDITGTGNLNKAGGGELRFTGTPKTYSGVTNINNGRLRIDDTGIPVNTTAFNLNGGNLRFGQKKFRTYSLGAGGNAPINIIGGGGSIEYTDDFGEGARLTNPVNVTGTGNFRSRAAGSVFEFTGPLTGNGTLNINQGSSGNPIQLGTIYLLGNASAFTGSVNVVQSTLRLGANTTLGANNFTLQSPSTLQIDIASPSNYGSINATGSVVFNAGSKIKPTYMSSLPSGNFSLTLITTTGSITDNGVSLVNTPLVKQQLQILPNQVILNGSVDYASRTVKLNSIERAVGRYLNRAGQSANLDEIRQRALNLFTDAEIQALYDEVAAEEVGGLLDSALVHAQERLLYIMRLPAHVRDRYAISDQLSFSASTAAAQHAQSSPSPWALSLAPVIQEQQATWTVFGDYFFNRHKRDRTFELGGYETNSQGAIVGAERYLSPNLALGVFASYEHSRTEFDFKRGWSDANSFGPGAMISWLEKNWHATLGFQYLRHMFKTERYTRFGTLRAQPEGNHIVTALQGGYDINIGRLTVTPTASLQYSYLWIDDYSESGPVVAQSFRGLDADSLVTGIGARVGYTLPGRIVSLRPEIFAEYRREFLDNDRTITSRLRGSNTTLKFNTPSREEDYFVLGGGLQMALTDSTSAYLQYESQLGDSDYSSHSIYGGFRWFFPGGPTREPALKFSDDQSGWVNAFWRSLPGRAMRSISLHGLLQLQYDHSQTENKGRDRDVRDPFVVNDWTIRRFRLYAERELGGGFYIDAAGEFDEHPEQHRAPFALFSANIGWNLFEPITLVAGYDRVPLGLEETTPSWQLKTIERSAASRIFTGMGGDDIGGFHLRAAIAGRLRELYSSNSGFINRYDFHYELAVANPREGADAAWEGDPLGILPHWPEPSYYLRFQNELRTGIGTIIAGCDLARINTFRARSDNQPTEADALTAYLNYNFGWLNLTAQWFGLDYQREELEGGTRHKPTGFTITPSIFIHPKWELVYSYSHFDTNGDYAIRLNSAVRNAATTYPFNRRFDNIYQHYFGVNHYIKGNDLKLMFGVENNHADGTASKRKIHVEDNWTVRARLQWMF
jgi:autotransporter-associated beta strand protein